ncbi:hypothetical protein R1sor_026549 [Riccia sorocarpa]|uniref:Uncharacterized protein n=1 Tax=Riccia sorocarpa TaxID=122646 RepID=A0ABD3GFC9_9MARC
MKTLQREQRAQISEINELGAKLKKLHENLPTEPTPEQLAEILEIEGDAPTKYFFKLHQKQIVQHQFSKFKLPDGSEMTCKTEITKEAARFFAALYSSENRTTESSRDIQLSNARLHNKITPAQRTMLEELPSSRELQDILHSFPKRKALGVDGANAEALQAVWDFTEQCYYQVLNQF